MLTIESQSFGSIACIMKTHNNINSSKPNPFNHFRMAIGLMLLIIESAVSRAQTPIVFGETKLNQTIVASQETTFAFAGAKDQLVTIQMSWRTGNNFYPTFDLISPAGITVATVNAGDESTARLSFRALPATGTYFINCRDSDGVSSGSYNLTLINHSGPNMGDDEGSPISAGETATGSVVPSDMDVFTFNVNAANEKVAIQMSWRTGNNFYPTFDIISPAGITVATVNAGNESTARMPLRALETTGTFSIICRDSDGLSSGSYNLTLIRVPGQNSADVEGGAIVTGQTRNGSVVPSDMDVFTFNGGADEKVTIQMSWRTGNNFYPTFELISPAGTTLTNVNAGNESAARLALYALPTTGAYFIVCRDSDGLSSGNYSLTVNILCATGDLDCDGLPDEWEVEYFGNTTAQDEEGDPDEDRLQNGEEFFPHDTNPTEKDTDHDGYGDGSEVALGSDPKDRNSVPSQLAIFVRTVDLEVSTVSGRKYELRATADLITWDLLSTIDGNDALYRTNIDIRGTGYKFFRAPDVTP